MGKAEGRIAADRSVVVVVGSLHYDIMVDAPYRPRKGETVTGFAWHPKFGGKGGNQAVAAAKAGAAIRMAGAVGDDDFGQFILNALDDAGIDATNVARLAQTGSGMSVAVSDAQGEYGAVIVSGANLRIELAAVAEPGLWRGASALMLQNEVPEALNVAAARAARAARAMVCLNAAPYRALSEDLSALVDLLVVNQIEAEGLNGAAVTDLASAAMAAKHLCARFPSAVVTAGSAGVAGMQRGQAPVTFPALPVKLVSTHGAGDTFVGALVVALAAGHPFAASLQSANAAAAAHVSAAAG